MKSECPPSQTFDRDGNGFIGASDLHNTYLAINEDLNDDEVKWNRFLMVERMYRLDPMRLRCPLIG